MSEVKSDIQIVREAKMEPIKDITYQTGTHNILLDGNHLSSGVYYYTLKAGEHHQVRKMLVMK